MDIQSDCLTDISQEFRGALLPDLRLRRRLGRIVDRLEEDPSASFPRLFGSGAELEGFYRFIRNPSVEASALLEAHGDETQLRAEKAGVVLALHDTTEFSFGGERSKLGLTSTNARGFFFHASLMVSASQGNAPLGLAQSHCYEKTERKGRRNWRERESDPDNPGRRWLAGVRAIERDRGERFECIHVADREADAYDFLKALHNERKRFVVRARANRLVMLGDQRVHLKEVLQSMRPQAHRQVDLAMRSVSEFRSERRRSIRPERQANLSIAAVKVDIASPAMRYERKRLEGVHLVRVWEEDPPKKEKPIEWLLWTSEPIETTEELETIVDHYRARWVIEEYFKALKTGCQIERRQLESMATLQTAIALFVPIAWKMLLARTVAQSHPEGPANEVVTETQLVYLEKRYKCSIFTACEAFLRVAQLGGHLSQNGEPGWLTLGRGFEKLRQLDEMLAVMKE